jgi:hypothetical protein
MSKTWNTIDQGLNVGRLDIPREHGILLDQMRRAHNNVFSTFTSNDIPSDNSLITLWESAEIPRNTVFTVEYTFSAVTGDLAVYAVKKLVILAVRLETGPAVQVGIVQTVWAYNAGVPSVPVYSEVTADSTLKFTTQTSYSGVTSKLWLNAYLHIK